MPKCRRWLLAIAFILLAPAIAHAREAAHGWCELGNRPVVTSGLTSSTLVQASYPQCTVTVLVHGGGLATIYSDNNGTVLANPFIAQTNGQWIWYANNGHYDVTISSSINVTMPQPVTYSDILLCDGNDSGAGTSCGGGGGTGGAGVLNFYALWTPNGTTLGVGTLLTVPSLYDSTTLAFSITGPLLFPFQNSASGTTQNLLSGRDSNGNAIVLPFGQVQGSIGVAYAGAGTSGIVQMAVAGKAIPCLFDNQTIINDYVIASITIQGYCHDSGISSSTNSPPGGFQNFGEVSINNAGPGTLGKYDNLPDSDPGNNTTFNNIAVNGVPIAGNTGNFNATTPAALANFQNLPWQTNNLNPTSAISVSVPLATTLQAGIVQLAKDLGGTSALPLVIGLQGNPLTVTTLTTNQVICATSPTSFANCFAGVPIRVNSGATDTILAADRVGWSIDTNAGNVAVTLPTPGSLGAANFPSEIINNGGGIVTVTPSGGAVVTQNGASATPGATFTIAAGVWCQFSTNNTDWFANCSGANLSAGQKRRTCMIDIGTDNGIALANADLGPQGRQCFVAGGGTVVEVTVAANAGTPSVIPARNRASVLANFVSGALSTAGAGGIACSNVGGTLGLDGATTCSATLQNTALNTGDWIDLVSGTAGGTAVRMSIAITWTVN